MLDYIYYITRDISFKTQESSVNVDSILYRSFLFLVLSKNDEVITPMTSNNDYNIIDIMTFCYCNITLRLICKFNTHVKYNIYCMTILHVQWPMLYWSMLYNK